ncbi:MAG: hypothetical protein IT245_03000, partial [Bacteroidia bacterium]|nr:hypothetical protein [Bacteroidia bacterium]
SESTNSDDLNNNSTSKQNVSSDKRSQEITIDKPITKNNPHVGLKESSVLKTSELENTYKQIIKDQRPTYNPEIILGQTIDQSFNKGKEWSDIKLKKNPALNSIELDPSAPIVDSIKIEEVKEVQNKLVLSVDSSLLQDSTKSIQNMTGWFVGGVTQIAYTNRILASSNNSIYNQIRNKSDKGFMQLAYGFEFGYKFKKDILSVGVLHTQQSWNSKYRYSYRIFDSLPVFDSGRVNVIGHFLVRGRDTMMDESSSIRISKIEIPFKYDRQMNINNKVNLLLGFGAVFGFNLSSKGDKILYPENRQLYYYHRWSNMERQLSISPTLSAGIQYKLSKQWLLQSDLNGRIYAQSRFKSSFGVGDFPYSFGFNIKLLYLLK